MATMIGALKVELTVILTANNNPEGMGPQKLHKNTIHTGGNINQQVNHHQQQPPFNATNQGQNQLQQAAYQYLNPSSFVPGFTPHRPCYTQANKTQ
eukprot:scaffold93266_cov54-Attheya_sp.AAC.6